jgi:GTPase
MKRNLPVIAVIGRPNVGKSTLINRICVNQEAIVHSEPMITRDRKYNRTDWDGVEFFILDTGGIDMFSEEKLAPEISKQSKKAIEEADIVIFVVDIRDPISPLDEDIADMLRKSGKPVIFTGNKWDSERASYFTEDYLKFGFGYPVSISAIHGLNISELLDDIIKKIRSLPVDENISGQDDEEDIEIPHISILGQPNVGKSTLFNTLINEERVIVDEVAGTTRDSIDSLVEHNGKTYKFVDTAGLKKDKIREEDLEFYSKIRTLKSIERSDVCLLLIDSSREITNQDEKILMTCLEKGASVCAVFNKIDILDDDELNAKVEDFLDRTDYLRFIPYIKISALKDMGIKRIFKIIEELLVERNKKIPDNKLNSLFKELGASSSLNVKGKKFKIKFIRQIRISPPGFLVFANMDISKKSNIKRYIESNLREKFGFKGTPIFLKFKY